MFISHRNQYTFPCNYYGLKNTIQQHYCGLQNLHIKEAFFRKIVYLANYIDFSILKSNFFTMYPTAMDLKQRRDSKCNKEQHFSVR